jgi:hypothetical protein
MFNLRAIAIVSLLLLAIAVGCSSSDQAAIDKAVSATQPVTVTTTTTATPEAAKEEIENVSIKILDIERRRTLLLENEVARLVGYSYDQIAFGQRREFGNLSDLLLELAMLQVPPNLQPVKDGLLEVYRLESSAVYFHQDCIGWKLDEFFGDYQLNCSWRRSSVIPTITQLNVVPTIDEAEGSGRLHFPNVLSPWTSAQLMRRTVYQYWYELLESNGTDTTHSDWRALSAVNDSQ